AARANAHVDRSGRALSARHDSRAAAKKGRRREDPTAAAAMHQSARGTLFRWGKPDGGAAIRGVRTKTRDRGCEPRSNEIHVSSFGALVAARTPLRRKH